MEGLEKTNLETCSMREYIRKQLENSTELSPKEEKELFYELKKGNTKAREKLIVHNLRLVYNKVSRHSYVDDNNFEDVYQYCTSFLIDAVDSFNVESGYKFSTYATKSIVNGIHKYFLEYVRTIRVPDNVLLKKKDILSKIHELCKKGYNLSEIGEELGLSYNRLFAFLQASQEIVSLSTNIYTDENLEYGDVIASSTIGPEEESTNKVVNTLIWNTLNSCNLSDDEKKVLYNLYCAFNTKELTKDQIAKKLGYSRQGLYVIESRAFKKIRQSKEIEKLIGAYGDAQTDMDNLKLMRKHYYNNNKASTSAPIGVDNGQIVALKR